MWQVTCSPRPPTLSQRHVDLHMWSYPDVVIYSKFHRNPLRGFGAPGGRNLPIPITLSIGFYNSLHYRASRDYYSRPALQMRTLHFCPVVSSSFFFLFSSPDFSGRRVDVYHTSTHGVALVRIYNAGLKCGARGSLEIQDAKTSQKIAIWAPSHNFFGLNLPN